jgi:myo-inositol-hexaphosphate 3-phosphohydrolase
MTRPLLVLAVLAMVLAWAPRAVAVPFASVTATVETDPVHGVGDAADDAAIWVDPTDPARSVVIGTDKSATGEGLGVYDLAGRELHFYTRARPNNVDLRYGFPLGARSVDLVGVSNRDLGAIDFYAVDPTDRSLTLVGSSPVSSAIKTSRGFAMYRSPTSGRFYAFVTDSGHTDQYVLDGSSGSVTATLVRRLDTLPLPTEGLVADDELGRIYVAEEGLAGNPDGGGIWRFGAEPTDPASGVEVVHTVEQGGPIEQDVKGLAIYYAAAGRGYLLAGSQGSDSFHIFDRQTNAWVGAFKIVDGNGIDKVTGEDGIDVTSFGLGSAFGSGMFVTTDFANDAGQNQNFKLVPWESIATSFVPGLTIDPSVNPRDIGLAAPPTPPPPAPPTVPPPAPPAPTPRGPVPSPKPTPRPASSTCPAAPEAFARCLFPRLSLRRRQYDPGMKRVTAVATVGPEANRLVARLRTPRGARMGRISISPLRGGRVRVSVNLTRTARRALRHRSSVRLTLSVTVRSAAGRGVTRTRGVVLRRGQS